MKPIRNSAKAIIIRDGRLLCTKNQDPDGYFYLLPGGGQGPGETLTEALRRECLEELSIDVTVHDLRFIREYIAEHHEFAEFDQGFHQVEFMFVCTLDAPFECRNGAAPDTNQIGFEWLPLDRLHEYRLYPLSMRDMMSQGSHSDGPVYLGDIN